MAELMRIQNSNPNVRMNLDKDVLKIFASDFKYKDMFEGKGQFNINAELGVLYNQYDGILEALGGSELSADQQLLYTSALQEKLIMGTVVREANIEIDKVKSISKEKD